MSVWGCQAGSRVSVAVLGCAGGGGIGVCRGGGGIGVCRGWGVVYVSVCLGELGVLYIVLS